MHQPHGIVLGTTLPPLPEQHVRIAGRDLTHHTLWWGLTGLGKTETQKSLLIQLISQQRGCMWIEPHSDGSRSALQFLLKYGFFNRPDAFSRLIYIRWGNGSYARFNILQEKPYASAKTIALNILEAYMRSFPEIRSQASFQLLFLSCLIALQENHLSIVHLFPLLSDSAFRRQCLHKVSDPLIQQTFAHMEGKDGNLQRQIAGSVLRRAFLTTWHDATRLSLGFPANDFAMRPLMDQGICQIHDLGLLDPETKRLVSGLLMGEVETAAFSRVDLPENERQQYTVIVDEWPAISPSDEAISTMLSQIRKFKVNLHLAGQSLGQISTTQLAGAFENCKMVLVMGLGYESAMTMARQIGNIDQYLPYDPRRNPTVADYCSELMNLPPQTAYLKIQGSPAVKFRTLNVPQVAVSDYELDQVLGEYKRRYQITKEAAEAAIAKTMPRNIPQPAADTGAAVPLPPDVIPITTKRPRRGT